MYTLNCKGKLLLIDKPLIMGIINATPDSFYEGHLNKGLNGILKLTDSMITDGADILDIGGQSTRPGSERISADEELKRVIPAIEEIFRHHKDCIISIDTYHSKVVTEAVAAGVSIVNDISAGNMDDKMIETIATLKVPYMCMHMQGTPETMQKNPQYKDVVTDVLDFFIDKIEECRKAGINDIIIDPGFGFGKTVQHNFQLLKSLNVFSILQKPILAGLSRKSFIYKTAGTNAEGALNSTIAANTIALMNGASILRVHDVKETKEVVNLYEGYKKSAR
jgi:dihydropteroate synthase